MHDVTIRGDFLIAHVDVAHRLTYVMNRFLKDKFGLQTQRNHIPEAELVPAAAKIFYQATVWIQQNLNSNDQLTKLPSSLEILKQSFNRFQFVKPSHGPANDWSDLLRLDELDHVTELCS